MNQTKPLLLISGFLGAGKTTLLRNLLIDFQLKHFKPDVILNDFVNAEMDSATLDTSSVTSVAPLSAGCACCESLEELVSLCKSATKGDGDLLLVELNGTADPLTLLETFTLLEDRLSFFPRFQVCVIDARFWGERDDYSVLKRRQLETASFWYLTHVDQVSEDRLDLIRANISSVAKNSSETSLNNLLETLISEIENPNHRNSTTPSCSKSDLAGHHGELARLDGQLEHVHDAQHKLSHRFTGYQIALPPRVNTVKMQQLMDMLPDWVLRVKALVTIEDKLECRWLFEKVGGQSIPNPIPVHDLPNTPSSIICIGPKLDPETLEQLVEAHF